MTSNAQNLKDGVDYQVSSIGFYNLENLFDTLDTEFKRDDDFLPAGKNRWNTEKYNIKLKNISKVISELGTEYNPDGIAMLGVSEIENRDVLEDLVKEESIAKRNYQIVHYESPDRRGIDVGLIYQPKYFKLESSQSFIVDHPADTSMRTRAQLLVTGSFQGERIHVIVAHWPSRSGGQKRSEPRRLSAALCGKNIVDSLLTDDPNAKILYMGDLNDDPKNKSVSKIMMGTNSRPKVGSGEMHNPMVDLGRQGIGSLAWRDTWNIFDQILMSPSMVDEDLSDWSYLKTRVYNKPYLCNSSGNYKGYPFRTFAGGAWQGGYSDHFPVYVLMVKEAG